MEAPRPKANRIGIGHVPRDAELAERLPGVLAVVHLVFTTGHHAPVGPDLQRIDLAEASTLLERALRLGRVGPYQVQVAISCLHSGAATADATDAWHLAHAVRADLLERSGRADEAADALRAALACAPNAVDRRLLETRLAALTHLSDAQGALEPGR